LLDAPVTSLDATVSEAQSLRYRLGKIYTQALQAIDEAKKERVLFFAGLVTLVLLVSLGWGIYNTQKTARSAAPMRRAPFILAGAVLILLVFGFFALPLFRLPSQQTVSASPEEQAAQIALSSKRMRRAAQIFGVTPESAPAIESSYLDFLARFDAHLAHSPYLLGGRPTIGDYGLIAALYAHLGRDPHPAALMKAKAWRVWRWTERMNAPDHDAGEYGDFAETLFADDSIPDSLAHVLAYIAEDYLPEIVAMTAFANDWLAANPVATGALATVKPNVRVMGETSFDWRGQSLTVGVFPYRLYLLQRILDAADALDAGARARLDALFARTGLSALLTCRPARRVERDNNLEVWGDAQ
jgi:hypothetical protein